MNSRSQSLTQNNKSNNDMMQSDDSSSVEVPDQLYDEESPPVEARSCCLVEFDGDNDDDDETSPAPHKKTRTRLDRSRSLSKIASEKDPRMRHSMRVTGVRRPSLPGRYSSRTSFSAGASGIIQAPPLHVLEDVDLEEARHENASLETSDKFGNKRLSAGHHSRRSSRGSTCTTFSASDNTVDNRLSQPGAYSVERDDCSVEFVVPNGDSPVLRSHVYPGGLIEATLVDCSPKPIPPVVHASPIEEATAPTKKANVFTCRGILCLALFVSVIVTPLATGLIISMIKMPTTNETMSTQAGEEDVLTPEPAVAPTSSTWKSQSVETDTLAPAPTASFSTELAEDGPTLVPVSLSAPAGGEATASPTPTSNPTFEPALFTAIPETSHSPSRSPSTTPSVSPSNVPTAQPSAIPSSSPTLSPSATPTSKPSSAPSRVPTLTPTVSPTATPTTSSTAATVEIPTRAPTSRRGNGNRGGNRKWQWVWSEKKQRWIRVWVSCNDC